MKNKVLFVLLILVLAIAVFPAKYEKKFHKVIPIDSIRNFKLQNVNGSIIVETSKNDKIVVDAVIKGKNKYKVEETKIDVSKSFKFLSVEVNLPRKSNVNVMFYLKLPESLKVKISSVNGRISSEGNFEYFSYNTVNGRILVNNDIGVGKIKTVNGSSEIHTRKRLIGNLSISTVNGSVRIYLGRADNLIVSAKTINGSIKIEHSDLKVTGKKSFLPFFPGKVKGEGKNPEFKLSVSTINGSIKILNE
jgi:hypothetical protein